MKIALIFSKKSSLWTSCQRITPNILKLYERQSSYLYPIHFNFHHDINAVECLQMAKKIKDQGIDCMAFLDHSPHPKQLLIPLEFLLGKTEARPKLIFHLYGDFTLYSSYWIELENILKRYKCKFLAASDREQMLVSQFIKAPQNKVFKLPFPVDEKQFKIDNKVRKTARKELNIQEKTPVFLYTGRISLQKNILFLINNFVRASKKAKEPPVLIIAGGFDNIGIPFTGHHPLPHYYSFQFYRHLYNINPKKIRIEFVGQLSLTQLFKYYNASDYFISLSTHNDEDFGMSPIEAMFCGNRSILTDWGGFASFQTQESFCQMIPVTFSGEKIIIDHNMAVHLYSKAMEQASPIKRKFISEYYQKKFGVRGLTNSLRNIICGPFSFFKSYETPFYLLNSCLKSSPSAPFAKLEKEKAYGPLYMDIYAPYFRNISKHY